jgi:itaconate CoA-transferase
VVTEYGWTDLKGKSSTERALSLIAIADPRFRDGLLQAARDLHLV